MRGHFQAVHLSRLWPVTVVTETGTYDVKDGVFTHRVVTEVAEASNALAYLRSAARRTHYLFEKYNCRYWEVPSLDEFTHVIIHYPALLELLASSPRPQASIIFDTHNNEREYFETVAARTPNRFKRAVISKQADVAERVIQKARGLIAATISVSESDRDWIESLCGSGVRHFVIPNNLFSYSPTKWTGRKSILYVGSLNVTMNLQALEWFTVNVWPLLRKIVPDVEFVVAGRDPSAALMADLKRKGVTVIANAPSLDPLYEDALCSLIPASSGSGGKIKVCEALSRGVPVITTPHGLVGQPAAIADCCIVREDPAGWVDAIRAQVERGHRSTGEWDDQVEAALSASYFGNSIKQISQYIESR
ncbi:glycosyltransferase [Mycolicibacterium gilvum]|nr:glycosyltransferase family 4 protein [Mycolicibacterium gilvum]MCV7055743.1 glycosyltransferase [Mycolicibacterium gilvum]